MKEVVSLEMEKFRLSFIRKEKHMMLSKTTSILLTQNLYDMLFQYVLTPQKEEKLQYFISLLENHIKDKSSKLFSYSLEDLKFLDEGLEEMKLLNWREIEVSVFALELCPEQSKTTDPEQLETIMYFLENILSFSPLKGSNYIYVYPKNLVY